MTYPASAPPAPARAPFVVLATLLAAALALGPAVVWSQVADAAMKLFAPDKTARPAGAAGSTSVTPFHLQANAADRALAVRCLTDAIYYEAATEPEAGQRAVAQVVINRLRDPHFPKSVCGVVYQGWRLKTGCQFSFTCDGSVRRRPAPAALWNKLVPLAQQALDGYVEPEVGAATFYYATYVQPYWLGTVKTVNQVGKQIFCTWKGAAGMAAALTGQYQGGEAQIGEAALDGGPLPKRPHTLRLVRVRFTRGHRASGRLRFAAARLDGPHG